MPTTRRKILKTGGAALLITASAGAGWALTRAPKKAREPWRDAQKGFGDPRLDILAYAILAPNPHNMQPWQITLDGDNGFTIYCDQNRLLPETDPPNRQITIGFGCFLELMRQAAAEKGLEAIVTPFPEGEPWPTLDGRPIAHVTLIENAKIQKDPLFETILKRRTNRVPFDTNRLVDQNLLDTIKSASLAGVDADGTIDMAMIKPMREFTSKAWETEWGFAPARRESIEVTFIGKKSVMENPIGVSLMGPLPELVHKIGVLNHKDMDIAGTTSYDQTLAFYDKACRTAMGYVWTTTATNTRTDQLNVGRDWVRMQMTANANGLSFHPLSQALQEFSAMKDAYREVHDMLAEDRHTVQMLSRIGYAKAPPPSPREPLTAKLTDA